MNNNIYNADLCDMLVNNSQQSYTVPMHYYFCQVFQCANAKLMMVSNYINYNRN